MNKKMRARKRRQARRVALTLVLMLTVALVSIGGTLAWLQASTDPVVNTFSPANISLELEETWNADSKDDEDEANDHWEAHMVPGTTVAKDPKVTASSDVPYYVFVKVAEANWNTNIGYSIASGWQNANVTGLATGETVYYKAMDANAVLTDDSVIADNQVTISSALTKETMPTTKPTLTITAYAIQQYKDNTTQFTLQEAWELASAQA